MEALLISTGIVALAEIGDKTQLLSFILAAKFRRPWPICLGILVATLANHALAGALGAWITTWVGPQALRWVLGLSFIAMAAWILVPDKFDESEAKFARMGVFGTTLVAFFLAEMGDKTQVATVALAAQYHAFVPVVLGTTLGMMIANVPAVLLGDKIATRMPARLVHGTAAAIFALLGRHLAGCGRALRFLRRRRAGQRQGSLQGLDLSAPALERIEQRIPARGRAGPGRFHDFELESAREAFVPVGIDQHELERRLAGIVGRDQVVDRAAGPALVPIDIDRAALRILPADVGAQYLAPDLDDVGGAGRIRDPDVRRTAHHELPRGRQRRDARRCGRWRLDLEVPQERFALGAIGEHQHEGEFVVVVAARPRGQAAGLQPPACGLVVGHVDRPLGVGPLAPQHFDADLRDRLSGASGDDPELAGLVVGDEGFVEFDRLDRPRRSQTQVGEPATSSVIAASAAQRRRGSASTGKYSRGGLAHLRQR
jgi:putative Ca2+/H+ antiporter (TMEM165/GDT1 family)